MSSQVREKIYSEYAGADYLEPMLVRRGIVLSDLGRSVADLLGYQYRGLYHIKGIVEKCEWDNTYFISITVPTSFSTFDFNDLTTLVFLAHRMAIRIEIQACNFHYLRLLFHRRSREGNGFVRHPDIREALETFEKDCYLPEVQPAGKTGSNGEVGHE
jgi:hypothetical protein